MPAPPTTSASTCTNNFNLAYELGYLVMHQGIEHQPGTKSVEAQAHRFGGAFLGPARILGTELPGDLNWGSSDHRRQNGKPYFL